MRCRQCSAQLWSPLQTSPCRLGCPVLPLYLKLGRLGRGLFHGSFRCLDGREARTPPIQEIADGDRLRSGRDSIDDLVDVAGIPFEFRGLPPEFRFGAGELGAALR